MGIPHEGLSIIRGTVPDVPLIDTKCTTEDMNCRPGRRTEGLDQRH